jgi:hypothetical protein
VRRSARWIPQTRTPLLLDGLPAAAAWSVRRIGPAVVPLVRVRRSLDNAEADISADGSGWLNQAALLAHVGGENFLLRSDSVSAPSWAASGSAVPTIGALVTDPFGGTLGRVVTFGAASDSELAQVCPLSSGTYTMSVWARSATGKAFRWKRWTGAVDDISADVATTSTWTRYSITFTSAVSNVALRNGSAGAAGDVEFYGAQLTAGATLKPYASTGATLNHGFITTRYDQSGNGRHKTQATSGSQLQIVAAGVVLLAGTRPAMVADATDDSMTVATWGTVAQPFTRCAVIRTPATITGSTWVTNTATGTPSTGEQYADATTLRMFAGSNGPTRTVAASELLQYSARYDGASSTLRKNGSASSASTPGTNALAGVTINSAAGAGFSGTTFLEEIVFTTPPDTTALAAIEANQLAAYGL